MTALRGFIPGLEVAFKDHDRGAAGEGGGPALGDVVVVTPLLDRLMHHSHLLKFEGKSWRLKEAATRVAKRARSA